MGDKPENWKNRIKFLVVEDDIPVRTFTVRILKLLGFSGTIYEAESGKEGLAVMSRDKDIHCIICDWHMSDIDGFAFIQRVRAERPQEDIAILMASGESMTGKITDVLEHGADDYLMKPFTTEDFQKKLDKVLSGIKEKLEQDTVR